MIAEVTAENAALAGWVHAVSWRESHQSFCSEAFVAQHTTQRQTQFLLKEIAAGKKVYLLSDDRDPVGVVSVYGNLIENLYVVPEKQNRGYGTRLLCFAMKRCEGIPTLWILENNSGARRLYERQGFVFTGRRKRLSETLSEIEMKLQP